ncbi:TAXI family TRAP transporter solute-binding subunit [Microcoleus sp. bin38.metabat.b11b12b14.051]|uniref:TAXI family TRAP transporter solute-binding subunit n=1 Tax=Microcoleus sp. bin38.metabat.b11b12b14.051 TaxID=2742709 RepID=UPI0025E7F997|nr:TAXI family TRAP transporter solute-binding subunit [Microcoleus sp. bin38.metabat.b11b12b14.051]
MQNKFLLPLALLSFVLIGAFGWKVYQDKERVYELTLATGTKTGNYHPFGEALAEVVAQQNPHIRIKVIETQGAEENMHKLQANQAQLAIVQNDTAAVPSARVIASLFKEVFHLIVSEKSGIQSVADLKGKRIALMAKGSGSYSSFGFMSEHYGLKETDFISTSNSWIEAGKLFSNGEVDAIFRVLPPGSDLVRDLLQNTRGRLVPIDQGAAMKIKLPYLEADVIPKGTYKADPPVPDADLATVGVQATLLAREDVNPEVVREITRILFEYRRNLVAANSLAAMISQPGGSGGLALPLHEGAQAYYDREKPDFWVANSDFLALWLSILTLFVSWLWQLRSRFVEKQKNQADQFNLAILSLIKKIRQAKTLQQIDLLQEELFNIFQQVIVDLDEDRIDSDSFQSFTFTWETAMKIARERENMLRDLRLASDNL